MVMVAPADRALSVCPPGKTAGARGGAREGPGGRGVEWPPPTPPPPATAGRALARGRHLTSGRAARQTEAPPTSAPALALPPRLHPVHRPPTRVQLLGAVQQVGLPRHQVPHHRHQQGLHGHHQQARRPPVSSVGPGRARPPRAPPHCCAAPRCTPPPLRRGSSRPPQPASCLPAALPLTAVPAHLATAQRRAHDYLSSVQEPGGSDDARQHAAASRRREPWLSPGRTERRTHGLEGHCCMLHAACSRARPPASWPARPPRAPSDAMGWRGNATCCHACPLASQPASPTLRLPTLHGPHAPTCVQARVFGWRTLWGGRQRLL